MASPPGSTRARLRVLAAAVVVLGAVLLAFALVRWFAGAGEGGELVIAGAVFLAVGLAGVWVARAQ